jgi:hypothetical protein
VLITFELQPCVQGNCDSLIEGEIHLDWNVQLAPPDALGAAVDKCLIQDDEELEEESKKYPDPSRTQAVQLMQMLEQERAVGAQRMNSCQSLLNVPIPRVQLTTQQKSVQTESPMLIRASAATDKKASEQAVKKHFKKITDILFPQ